MTSGVFAEPGDPLTPREREVIIAYAYAGSTQDAADLLGIQKRTLKHHLTAIYRKMGVKSGIQAWSRFYVGTTEAVPNPMWREQLIRPKSNGMTTLAAAQTQKETVQL